MNIVLFVCASFCAGITLRHAKECFSSQEYFAGVVCVIFGVGCLVSVVMVNL